MMRALITRCFFSTAFLAILAFLPVPANGDGLYLRGGLGVAWSDDAAFFDADCRQTQPPALFGCRAGIDGRPIGARGDFGRSAVATAGLGFRVSPYLRAELQLNYQPGLEFVGGANFLGVTGPQPVTGELDTVAAFAAAYIDLPRMGRWQPYLGAGAGLARNDMGAVTYRFPGLGGNALTRIAGGTQTGFAWFAGAGVNVALSRGLSLDITYRYSDLGEVRTDAGPAAIVRGAGATFLVVGATETELTTQGLRLSLRYRF